MDTTTAPLQPEQKEEVTSVVNDVQNPKEDPSDKLTVEHPRFKDVLARAKQAETETQELKAQIAELKAAVDARQTEGGSNYENNPEYIEAVKNLEQSLKKRGFVTQEELNKEKRIQRLEQQFETLSSTYDGKNGYPKFDAAEVTAYAKSNGLSDNLEAAYKQMHWSTIIDVEKKRSTTVTVPESEKPTGGERAISEGITPRKISEMSPYEWEQHRDKVLKALKPQRGGDGM
jgi:uncharacterized membrane protein YqiK